MTFPRVALVIIAFLGAAAPAGAAPAWLAPVDLSVAGQTASNPQVAVDAQGNAVAVWQRAGGASFVVQAAARPAGGAWQAPVEISAVSPIGIVPQVAIDPQGNAVAVWSRFNGVVNVVQAAVRPAGGSWQAPVDLSDDSRPAVAPQVAVDAAGNAVAVWRRSNGSHGIVQAVTRPAGGAWSAPVDLSADGQSAAEPGVAVGPQGNAVAVWRRSNGTSQIVQASVRAAGGTWEAPVDLSANGQDALVPQVAVDAQGNAVAVWSRSNGANPVVQGAVRVAGGVWQGPVDLSVAGQSAADPHVAVDAQGNAMAVWFRYDGANTIVQASVRAPGGVWQGPVNLSAPTRNAVAPQVAFDAQGNALAVWQRTDGAHFIVQSAVRPAGGAWQQPVDLSSAGQNAVAPQVGFDAQGNAVAVWGRSNGANDILQAAGYDAAGPLLNGLSVPASGVVGEPLSFALSPLDVWSALGATSWTMGDTRTATGVAVTHTYASAGTYTVGVSAADALGNTTSTTRTVTIGAAPTPPPTTPPVVVPPTPPQVTALRLSPARFRAAASGPAVKAAAVRTGTRVSYTLNVAARVRFAVQRAFRGRRAGRRCVKQTQGNRRARRCTRYVRVRGGFARTRPAGTDRFTFTGRLRGRPLKPGRYRLIATPAEGTPARASFRVVR